MLVQWRKFFNLNKNIKLARYAGFCHGVKRAVDTVKQIKNLNKNKNVWVLGELIHNSSVIDELESLGIHTVSDLKNCEKGICVVRSHGMPQKDIENIENQGFEIVDLTCPDVKNVQNKAIELAKQGYPLLITGKGEHPEVIAIKANAQMYSDKVFVISETSELDLISDVLKREKKAGVVVQTTQKAELLSDIVSKLVLMVDELKIFNTICKSTALRQNAAKELAKSSDLMIVIGGKNSANTTHLFEILSNITSAIHIETVKDLNEYTDLIKKSKNIGITAGASTPESIINDIIVKLNEI